MATGLIDIKQHAQALNQARNAPWSAPVKQALEQTQDNLNRMRGDITSLESQISPLMAAPSKGLVPKVFFVTAPLVVPVPSEPINTVFIYIFEQDATGGHAVTLPNPPFIGFVQIGTAAKGVSSYMGFKATTGNIVAVMTGIGNVIQP